ncbi:YajQ family cyclic di-GMP-binding protein [Maridesulfovibrio bastinii]|uniref:YajQ family cyclic di-GMP-binding protein n=1 Tax=Maridesulfovibrio bastinii TaxID=47157 RepID=UPI0003F9A78C|nr:YajQ family cyclic di-GMP-binding protein [Maridesulfovibrio bastinii]
MPSFDIVSEVDIQEVDNAVNNTVKEVDTRYDFRGIETTIDLNKKDRTISLVTGDEMKVKAVRDMLITHFTRRKVDSRVLEFGEYEPTSKGQLKQLIKLKEGISKEDAKKVTKIIKDSKLKVQPSIQDNQIRVTGKKLDDLQAVISLVRDCDVDLPFQFVNMKK